MADREVNLIERDVTGFLEVDQIYQVDDRPEYSRKRIHKLRWYPDGFSFG